MQVLRQSSQQRTAKRPRLSQNWTKSSKAMESDMAVDLLHELKSKGIHVDKLIMDNDSTTISRFVVLKIIVFKTFIFDSFLFHKCFYYDF